MAKVKKKILIVEDDITLRDLYQTRLEIDGYNISVAGDGEEGVMQSEKVMPDLILLDLMLPKLSGMEVLQKIKENPKTKGIPVIILSALSNQKTKGLIYGAIDYLVKSESQLEDIVNKVKEVLAKAK